MLTGNLGSFTCTIAKDGRYFVRKNGRIVRDKVYREEVIKLVKEVQSFDEPWNGRKCFDSILENVSVHVRGDGVKVLVDYWHEDGLNHDISREEKMSAYSVDILDSGFCYHLFPGNDGYVHENISSLDELFSDDDLYAAFRKRYNNIVEFHHAYGFWCDKDECLF